MRRARRRTVFLKLALEPAEQLMPEEKAFTPSYFFQANEERVIKRSRGYPELFNLLRMNEHIPGRVHSRGNAATERRLAKLLWAAGLRGYRKHWLIAGKPDFAWPGRQKRCS